MQRVILTRIALSFLALQHLRILSSVQYFLCGFCDRLFLKMNSFTEENYLKALFNLGGETGEVNVNDLSKALGIKMPTVTSMMKKLADKKLVNYESYKPMRLTEKGKKEDTEGRITILAREKKELELKLQRIRSQRIRS